MIDYALSKQYFDPLEIVSLENQDDTYIWCYPTRLGELDPASIWENIQVQKVEEHMTIHVHIPFCHYICTMCPFTHEPSKLADLDRYVTALIKEITFYGQHPLAQRLSVSTLYFGGGTASVLSPAQLERILHAIDSTFRLNEECEITLECHPMTMTPTLLAEVKSCGINRISFGIQSFQDKHLKSLKLHQQPKQSIQILEQAIATGFNTVAMDIMYNFPGQTVDELDKDINQALTIGVQGLSLYALDAKVRGLDNIATNQPVVEIKKEMFYHINDRLNNAGFIQVAQPDYARSGHENRQVHDIWGAPQAQNLSFGAGAFSTAFNDHTWVNVHDSKQYIDMLENHYIPLLIGRKWTLDDALTRWFVLGARCLSVPFKPFEEQFHVPADSIFRQEFDLLKSLGWVTVDDSFMQVTKKGAFYIDNISKIFFNPANRGVPQLWGVNLQNKKPTRTYQMKKVFSQEVSYVQ